MPSLSNTCNYKCTSGKKERCVWLAGTLEEGVKSLAYVPFVKEIARYQRRPWKVCSARMNTSQISWGKRHPLFPRLWSSARKTSCRKPHDVIFWPSVFSWRCLAVSKIPFSQASKISLYADAVGLLNCSLISYYFTFPHFAWRCQDTGDEEMSKAFKGFCRNPRLVSSSKTAWFFSLSFSELKSSFEVHRSLENVLHFWPTHPRMLFLAIFFPRWPLRCLRRIRQDNGCNFSFMRHLVGHLQAGGESLWSFLPLYKNNRGHVGGLSAFQLGEALLLKLCLCEEERGSFGAG